MKNFEGSCLAIRLAASDTTFGVSAGNIVISGLYEGYQSVIVVARHVVFLLLLLG